MQSGIIVINKPKDLTSQAVVSRVKRLFGEKKAGHTGTLDPMATGVLPVLLGRAVKASDYMLTSDKYYRATLTLGLKTDTEDATGTVLYTHAGDIPDEDEVRRVIGAFVGKIKQTPPMYSAIKMGGKKLCDLARAGVTVEREAREITVHSIKVTRIDERHYSLDVHCQKGTYIRTLCHDIGQKLGCGACMTYLRRVEAGEFSVDNAVTIEYVQRAADEGRTGELLMPVDHLFASYPEYAASDVETQRIKCGNEIRTGLTDGKYRVYSAKGEFLMLGQVSDGIMRTVKSFFEVEVK